MKYLKSLKQELRGLSGAALRQKLCGEPVQKVGVAYRLKDLSEGSEETGILETFRVTDSGVDREGDIILSAGIDSEMYERAGSLLWGHRADSPDMVLGAPAKIVRGETSIDVQFRFATESENPVGAMVGRMVRGGLVSGTSVGILIREFSEATDRGGYMPLNIMASELMEVSVTPIPANPRALRQDDQALLAEVLEERLDTVDDDPYQEYMLAALRDLSGQRKTIDLAAGDPVVAAFVKAAIG